MLALHPSLESLLPYAAKAPLNVAVVGVGRRGRAILTELGKIAGVKVVALVDASKGDSTPVCAARRAPRASRRTKEMLDKVKAVEAVFVATPTHLHREPVVDALSAGKHVYCEAPLAHSMDDLVAITKAARASKALFQTGMGARSNPSISLRAPSCVPERSGRWRPCVRRIARRCPGASRPRTQPRRTTSTGA
jgi:FlaA1/EpsC-like NDP-sugar epimerase